MKFIVTTTIFEPSKAVKLFADLSGWQLIVVGDKKTPHDSYRTMSNLIYLDPEYQETYYKELSDLVGWNCIQRRNIGYIEAYRLGATVIASVDDDNVPKPGWGDDLLLGIAQPIKCYTPTDVSVFDPLSATNHKELWHRGYPLDMILKKNSITSRLAIARPSIQANFWDGDPDVDAISRLTVGPVCKFNDECFPFYGSVIGPFNSQNTFFTREAMKDYFLFPQVGRMDDIWGSYYAQAKGHTVVYDKATVVQERNEHDYLVDFLKEVPGYLNNSKLIKALATNPEAIQQFIPEQSYKALKAYQKLFV